MVLTVRMNQRLFKLSSTFTDIADELESHNLGRLATQTSRPRFSVLFTNFANVQVWQRDRARRQRWHRLVFEVNLAAATQRPRELAKICGIEGDMPM